MMNKPDSDRHMSDQVVSIVNESSRIFAGLTLCVGQLGSVMVVGNATCAVTHYTDCRKGSTGAMPTAIDIVLNWLCFTVIVAVYICINNVTIQLVLISTGITVNHYVNQLLYTPTGMPIKWYSNRVAGGVGAIQQCHGARWPALPNSHIHTFIWHHFFQLLYLKTSLQQLTHFSMPQLRHLPILSGALTSITQYSMVGAHQHPILSNGKIFAYDIIGNTLNYKPTE